MTEEMKKYDFCKGCKWDKDHKNCPHDSKEELLTHEDGSYQMGYCSEYKIERPEGQPLQAWIKWSENLPNITGDRNLEDHQKQAEKYNQYFESIKLFSLDEIKNIINHWRQDQGSLFDEDTDIPRLIKLFKDRGDSNGECKKV